MNRLYSFVFAAALFVFAASARAQTPAPDGKVHQFTLHDAQFFIDGTPIRIMSGEMHPGRIPPDQWDDRIKKAKAMGLNTVSVYLFWNQIEPADGEFVFDGFTDIRRFVKLCQDNGMWMIVRAGPYICGEWEFGGFPAWLLKHKGIQLRTTDAAFLDASQKYVEKIHDQIGDLQVTHGGPILLVQFENENHHADSPYMRAVHDIFVKAGFDTQLMTCDPGAPTAPPWSVMNGIPGVLRGYNGFNETTEARFVQSTKLNQADGFPVLSPEVYTGWFNTWGPVRKAPYVSVDRQVLGTTWLLAHKNLSFSYYVFDGGTNFGYWGGANNGVPMQTSYDYDAPIDELGRVTPKYRALRDLFIKTLNLQLPAIPADPNVIEIPAFSLTADSALLEHLPTPVSGDHVLSMEDLGQNFGFVDYQKTFDAGLKGTLNLSGAKDYAVVMIDRKVVGEAFGGYGRQSFTIKVDHAGPCVLDILVHNLGRDSLLPVPTLGSTQSKGLRSDPTLDGTALTGWAMYPMPLDNPDDLPPVEATRRPIETLKEQPAFYKGTFKLDDLGETYLDMSTWHMGVVWVNGHNLGRYWNVGDGRSIYLPSSWEKKGENTITVLEMGTPPENAQIAGAAKMVRPRATRFAPFWTGH
jgi:beta-galactosidase